MRWDEVLRDERLLFVEKKEHAVKLTSQDLTRMHVDAYLVICEATPIADAGNQEER